jgi:hypothetical protein
LNASDEAGADKSETGKLGCLSSVTQAPGIVDWDGGLALGGLYRIPATVRDRAVALILDGAAESGVQAAVRWA